MATNFDISKEKVTFEDLDTSPRTRKSASSLSSIQEQDESDVRGRGANKKRTPSEWAVLPLKVKFKIKELEKIYDRSVYRYRQELLIKACFLAIFVTIISLCVFLGKEKVIFGVIIDKCC